MTLNRAFNFLSSETEPPAPLSNPGCDIVIQSFPTAVKKAQRIDRRSVKHERSANTSARRKNDASRLHGDFPRRGARSTVSCQSLRRLEVINYADERLMMPRRRSRPSGSLAKSHPSSRGSLERTHFRDGAIFPDRPTSACGIPVRSMYADSHMHM